MGYEYNKERAALFTDEGQRLFLAIRDKTKSLLAQAGAARCDKMIAGNSGSSWQMLACVDRMVEIGELKELTGNNAAGQHRVFINARCES